MTLVFHRNSSLDLLQFVFGRISSCVPSLNLFWWRVKDYGKKQLQKQIKKFLEKRERKKKHLGSFMGTKYIDWKVARVFWHCHSWAVRSLLLFFYSTSWCRRKHYF